MKKNPAAVELGRKGGSTKTDKTKRRGFASLTPEQRREMARRANEARWGKKK